MSPDSSTEAWNGSVYRYSHGIRSRSRPADYSPVIVPQDKTSMPHAHTVLTRRILDISPLERTQRITSPPPPSIAVTVPLPWTLRGTTRMDARRVHSWILRIRIIPHLSNFLQTTGRTKMMLVEPPTFHPAQSVLVMLTI